MTIRIDGIALLLDRMQADSAASRPDDDCERLVRRARAIIARAAADGGNAGLVERQVLSALVDDARPDPATLRQEIARSIRAGRLDDQLVTGVADQLRIAVEARLAVTNPERLAASRKSPRRPG